MLDVSQVMEGDKQYVASRDATRLQNGTRDRVLELFVESVVHCLLFHTQMHRNTKLKSTCRIDNSFIVVDLRDHSPGML